jgi:hypothetical protein
MPEIVKFSDEDCGTCHRMSKFDEKVCSEFDINLIKVTIQDIDSYANYRHVLLAVYPDLNGIGFPTYIVVDQASSLDVEVKGVIRGGMDKGSFRERVTKLM